MLDCDEIIKGRLWVGSYIRPEDVHFLVQLGITTVLSLQSERDREDYSIPIHKVLRAYELAEIRFLSVPILDFNKSAMAAGLPYGIEELEKALLPPLAKVYVHCTAGINRSPTLAAAYLIRSRELSAQEAYDYVTKRRDCSPYLDILEEYDKCGKTDVIADSKLEGKEHQESTSHKTAGNN